MLLRHGQIFFGKGMFRENDPELIRSRLLEAELSTNTLLRICNQTASTYSVLNDIWANSPDFFRYAPTDIPDTDLFNQHCRAVAAGTKYGFDTAIEHELANPSTEEAQHLYQQHLNGYDLTVIKITTSEGMSTATNVASSILQTVPIAVYERLGKLPSLREINRVAANSEDMALFLAGGNLDIHLPLINTLTGEDRLGPLLPDYVGYNWLRDKLDFKVDPYSLQDSEGRVIGDIEPRFSTTKCPLNISARLFNKNAPRQNGIQMLYRWQIAMSTLSV